jgi:hypothetical protein
MAGEIDQTLHVTGDAIIDKTKTASREESGFPTTSSSSNAAVEKMANKTTPTLSNYWKKLTVTEVDHSAYHTVGWLGSGLQSFIPEVDVPTVDNSIVVCFECHLVAGLGLLLSKFLVVILNFLGCELVHLNPNAIATLSCFTMLCECWLRTSPGTSLFWYFYYPTRYDKTVFSGIGLSLHRHRWKEYLDATFKAAGKVLSESGFLLICTFSPNGRTCICSRRLLMTSGENLKEHRAWLHWPSG